MAMLELTAYSDESETEHEVYCVAGYWAATRDWERFDWAWKQQLGRRHLNEFHAEHCEHGSDEYEGREDRIEMRDEFVRIINEHPIHGMFAVVDLRAWDTFAAEIKRLRPRARSAFYIAFQMYLEAISAQVDNFPLDERLALVFDNRPESGKVIQLFNWLKATPDPIFKIAAGRLGDVASACSERHPGLQAADLLAYEARKYVAGAHWGIKPRRGSAVWGELSRKLPDGRGIAADALPRLVQIMRDRVQGASS
jgi:hypothetical protein